MGRETRQQRRARERRQGPQAPTGVNWSLVAGAAIVLAIAAFLASQALGFGKGTSAPQAASKSIDSIPCGQETVTYHEHAHLTVLDRGKSVSMPPEIGVGSGNCLYWLHTHDESGAIHIEAPSSGFHPTLGNLADIARYTNGESILPAVKSGQQIKVYVNQKRWTGNLRNIALLKHTTITVEVGPPFKPPQKYNFGNL